MKWLDVEIKDIKIKINNQSVEDAKALLEKEKDKDK